MEGDAEKLFEQAKQEDFYPRPHMEGDAGDYSAELTISISTHALTWRATRSSYDWMGCGLQFLPTPSHGGRPLAYTAGKTAKIISTHALTWRATRS